MFVSLFRASAFAFLTQRTEHTGGGENVTQLLIPDLSLQQQQHVHAIFHLFVLINAIQ